MFFRWALFIASLGVLALSLLEPRFADLILLGVPCAVASLILVIHGIWGGKLARHPVIIDGSNVMYWYQNTPQLSTVRTVIKQLRAEGFSVGVVFDANAGHLLSGRYLNERQLAKRLRLSSDRVVVAPKGTQADPIILNAARNLGARVVSNDRFRDWAEQYPEVHEPAFLIGGGFRNDALTLKTKPPEPAQKAA